MPDDPAMLKNVTGFFMSFCIIFVKYFILTIMCGIQYNMSKAIEGDNLDYSEIVSGLILELRRGTLTLLVLSQLKKPMYGYNLVKNLESVNIPIEANTLYPLLRRLEAQGLLSSEWDMSGSKPRKYYILTPDGKIVLNKVEKHWFSLTANVNSVLEVSDDEK